MKTLLRTIPCLLSVCLAYAADRPNVLFIAVDDLRPELGCYGKDYIKSPSIDRLASSGMVFDRAYCQQAVCSPSRSSLMTGTRPDTTKVWDLVTHFRAALPEVVTLGQHFKNNGYFVQGMGKIYHGGYDDPQTWSVPWQTPKATPYALPENLALNQRQYEGEPDGGAKPKPKKKKKAQAASAIGAAASSKPNSRGPAFEGADAPDNTFQDGKVAELAISTLRDLSKKPEPFFLAVGFIRPHLPFVSPRKYWDLYDPAKIQLAPNPFRPKDAPDYAVLPGGELRNYHGIPEGSVPDDLARRLKHGYYAAVSYMDAQVGKLLDELDRLNLRTNTIVILWGDHGWKLGEHDAWCKHSNVENDLNAPLILSVPGMKSAGAHTDALVEFVDIYPTLSELAGLRLPAHLEGTSFKPLLDDPKRSWKTAAFSQYPRKAGKSGAGDLMGYSMRTDRYRFTQWVNRDDHSKVDAVELYDHQRDPQENQNIAGKPESAVLVKELSAKLQAGWRAEALSGAREKPVDLRFEPDPALPNVLLLGDSISIGYTQPVRDLLRGKANVCRPLNADGTAENCSDTGKGLQELARWLALRPKWDVIHFNWGLHDLKHMQPGAPKPTTSANPNDPPLRSVEDYRANLEKIVARLEQTGARLIFATTTPVPEGVRNPFRRPDDPPRYNAGAISVMKVHNIPVDDLFALVQSRLSELQLARNVHFTDKGSEVLAGQVAAAVTGGLVPKGSAN